MPNLNLQVTTSYRVSLFWDTAPLAANYRIYRNNLLLATVDSNVTTYNDDTGVIGQQYIYRITGVDSVGVETNKSEGQEITILPNSPTLKAELVKRSVFFVNAQGQEVSPDNLSA